MSVRAVLKVGCVVKHDLSFASFVPVRVTSFDGDVGNML